MLSRGAQPCCSSDPVFLKLSSMQAPLSPHLRLFSQVPSSYGSTEGLVTSTQGSPRHANPPSNLTPAALYPSAALAPGAPDVLQRRSALSASWLCWAARSLKNLPLCFQAGRNSYLLFKHQPKWGPPPPQETFASSLPPSEGRSPSLKPRPLHSSLMAFPPPLSSSFVAGPLLPRPTPPPAPTSRLQGHRLSGENCHHLVQ